MKFLKLWAATAAVPILFQLAGPGHASVIHYEVLPSGRASTGLIWPVPGRVTSEFGLRRAPDHGESEFHTGIDIGADYGTTVRAATGGTVVFAGIAGSYGKLVILEHRDADGTFQTWYGHLLVIDVEPGEVVHQGHEVGLVGDTGRSIGPHLHFEYRVNGKPLNPLGLYL